jgi:hypothetical protein
VYGLKNTFPARAKRCRFLFDELNKNWPFLVSDSCLYSYGEGSKIKCIRAGKTKGLTDDKEYKVIRLTDDTYYIMNNYGLFTGYKKNRFSLI